LLFYLYLTFIHSKLLSKFDKTLSSMIKNEANTFNESELDLLKEGLKRTYKERFEMTTRLYKMQQTMNKATITHKTLIKK